MNRIVKVVEDFYGTIPNDIGRIFDTPITQELDKETLLAIIWWMEKQLQEKDNRIDKLMSL